MPDASHRQIVTIQHYVDGAGRDVVTIAFDDGSEETDEASWASARHLATHSGLEVQEDLGVGVTLWSRRARVARPWQNPLTNP